MRELKDEFILKGLPPLHGVLADLANNFVENAYRPHEISAYLSALIFGAAVCSRNYSFAGSYSNLYMVVFGSSGSGKNDLEKMLTRWSYDISCPDIIMNGSSFSSDAGVHSALVSQPQSLVCIDEYGRVLNSLASDVIAKTALVTLTKAYTLSDMMMKPKKYSKDKRAGPKDEIEREQVIIRPALSLLGFGTPDQMQEVLKEDNFQNGEMARYMFWYIPDVVVSYQLKNTHLPRRVFQRIATILELAKNHITTGDLPDSIKLSDYESPLSTPIPCTLEAGILDLKRLDIGQQTRALACEDPVEKTLETRCLDKAKRLSIILSLLNSPYADIQTAASIRENGVIITQRAMADAIEIAGKSNKVMKKYQTDIPTYPPRIVRAGKRIDELVHMCGKGWTTREEIALNKIKVSPGDWKLVEEYLEDIGIGWRESVLPGQKGRSVKIYGSETPMHMEPVKYELE